MTSAADPDRGSGASAPAAGGPTLTVGALWCDRGRSGDTITLVRSPGGGVGEQWRLPGGAVQRGETLVEAVVRGAEEELGVAALCGPAVGWFESIGPDSHLVVMVFTLVVDPSSVGALPSGVEMTPDWQVSELPLQPGLAEFLADEELIELLV